MSGATVLGVMCRSSTRQMPAPMARDASTKACSLRVSTRARTRRTTRGTSGMVRAMMTFCTLAFISAIRAMASRMAGMAMRPSMMRMTTASTCLR